MTLLGLVGPLGFQEILVLLVIVIFLFGARRIPEIAKGLGEGIRGFRSALRGEDDKEDGSGKSAGSTGPTGPSGG